MIDRSARTHCPGGASRLLVQAGPEVVVRQRRVTEGRSRLVSVMRRRRGRSASVRSRGLPSGIATGALARTGVEAMSEVAGVRHAPTVRRSGVLRLGVLRLGVLRLIVPVVRRLRGVPCVRGRRKPLTPLSDAWLTEAGHRSGTSEAGKSDGASAWCLVRDGKATIGAGAVLRPRWGLVIAVLLRLVANAAMLLVPGRDVLPRRPRQGGRASAGRCPQRLAKVSPLPLQGRPGRMMRVRQGVMGAMDVRCIVALCRCHRARVFPMRSLSRRCLIAP